MHEHRFNHNNTNMRTRTRRRLAVNFAAVVAVLYHPSCVGAFRPAAKTTSRPLRRTRTEIHFRTSGLEGTETFAPTTVSLLQPTGSKSRAHLPTWLAMPKSHLAEHNLSKLQAALRESYFTESEALKLLFAIQEAAGNDGQKVAGAAEFCLMLAETMELGLDAFVAAAFHYCSCVTAREQQTTVLSERYHMASFGDHVVRIARDAARLKELEMVAARIVEQKPQHAQQDAVNLRMLMLSESKDWRALAIRSAACLYRLRGILESDHWKQLDPEKIRVAREALWIYAPTASSLGMHRLKNELEGAAFQILYRKQYEVVTSLRSNLVSPGGPTVQESMNNVLKNVQEEMTVMLQQDEQFSSFVGDFTVTARVKEPYSMWCKLKNNNYKSIREVPDAIALRIVLNAAPETDEPAETLRARERALCYYAQKLCMERWKPQPDNPRFKDYIAKPKPNGYQSLHYTARTSHENDDWSLEIQVRSGEMHKVAEYGLASHWEYKAQKKNKRSPQESHVNESSDAYLRKVQQWHWEQHVGAPLKTEDSRESDQPVVSVDPWLEAENLDDLWQSRVRSERIRARTRLQPYIEALTNTQSDLTRDYVFVFFEPQGSVLSLPAGACVVDALKEGFNEGSVVWEHMSGTSLNGEQTTVTRRLCNGDVLTLAK